MIWIFTILMVLILILSFSFKVLILKTTIKKKCLMVRIYEINYLFSSKQLK